jgi:hypothetical protein
VRLQQQDYSEQKFEKEPSILILSILNSGRSKWKLSKPAGSLQKILFRNFNTPGISRL